MCVWWRHCCNRSNRFITLAAFFRFGRFDAGTCACVSWLNLHHMHTFWTFRLEFFNFHFHLGIIIISCNERIKINLIFSSFRVSWRIGSRSFIFTVRFFQRNSNRNDRSFMWNMRSAITLCRYFCFNHRVYS